MTTILNEDVRTLLTDCYENLLAFQIEDVNALSVEVVGDLLSRLEAVLEVQS